MTTGMLQIKYSKKVQTCKASLAGTSFKASLPKVASTSFEQSGLLFHCKLTSILVIYYLCNV